MYQSGMQTPPSQNSYGPQWIALRTTSIILKIIAGIYLLGSLAFTALATIGILQNATSVNLIGLRLAPMPLVIISLIIGLIGFIVIYAFAELILLFIAIEQNTRMRNGR